MAGNSLSVVGLIMGSSLVVKLVLLILLAASIWSWATIFSKFKLLKEARLSSKTFLEQFWSGTDLVTLQNNTRNAETGLALLFNAGFNAFTKMQDTKALVPAVLENVERAMRIAFSREHDRMEDKLTFLATIGSVSPYVGLFGTVWGIMTAFIALGGVEQATLSMVAPGIAEALIATAMGLFAAIPAVIAYNRFLAAIERELNQYENFEDEFINILSRQLEAKGR